MTKHMSQLSALTVVLLAILTGCRESAKSSASGPVFSPALSAHAQQPASVTPKPTQPTNLPVAKAATHEPPPPPLETMVPVKTLQIHPPAAFTADQLPKDEAVEFDFAGRAGQMLRVRVGSYRVRIQPPGGGSALQHGWDSVGNWLYGLPRTGTYSVLYAPWHTTPSIEFEFLADNDPLADPGIKPEQVSIDFGSFAQNDELMIAPYAVDTEGELFWESWPTHLAVDHRGFEFRIMTVSGNKKLFKKYERMTALEAAIQKRGIGISAIGLPYPVYGDAGLNLATQPRFLEGDGWRGLRWIGQYSQDFACGVEEMAYVFEGITNDGRYFILMRAAVSNPAVGRQLSRDCAIALDATPKRNMDALFKNNMPAIFEKDLSTADPASFQPNLDRLDAVIRSLKLKPSSNLGGTGE